MSASELNELDKGVIRLLYGDSTRSEEETAEELDVEVGTVSDRVETLREEGYIGNEKAVIDPAKVGYSLPSYHFVNLEVNYDTAIRAGTKYFGEWKGSQLAMVVLGDYDVILKKLNTDKTQLDNFATNVLASPPQHLEESESNGDLLDEFINIETFDISQRIRWHGQDIPASEQRGVQSIEISDSEAQVLELLQQDGSLRNHPQKISSRTDITPGEAADAISHLEQTGVIRGYSIHFDPDLIGWHRAFFGLSTKRGHYENVLDQIYDEAGLNVPYVMSGTGFNWADIAVELVFSSISELDELTDRIRKIDGVRASRTFLSTKGIYFDDSIPINS